MRIDRKKLVLAMMDKDINSTKLATLAKLSRATVCSIKNGKSCTEETAIKIATALKTDVSNLLED